MGNPKNAPTICWELELVTKYRNQEPEPYLTRMDMVSCNGCTHAIRNEPAYSNKTPSTTCSACNRTLDLLHHAAQEIIKDRLKPTNPDKPMNDDKLAKWLREKFSDKQAEIISKMVRSYSARN